MKAKYVGESIPLALTQGIVYDILAVEDGADMGKNKGKWYRVMTDTGEDYLFLPDDFELIEE